MRRIGVFVCHCGKNIARSVDVERVVAEVAAHPGVAFAQNYVYMCSEPGQALIKEKIASEKLEAVVVAACSPMLHAVTFGRTVERAGVNRYLMEMANIREHCSWVHADRDAATHKAAALAKSAVEKLKQAAPLTPIRTPLTRRAVVVGGGIAGIQAALDIANGGHEVYLVEKSPTIGGHMAQLSETFPTLDCSSCILTPKMVEVKQHPNIHLLTYSEVKSVEGSIGSFKVTVERKPRYVLENLCTGCGECVPVCPVVVHNEFEMGMGGRKAIYIPFPQAVPSVYTLDLHSCYNSEKLVVCENCYKACGPKAINYLMEPEIIEIEAGAVVLATGYDLMPIANIGEYGADGYEDVIDSLQFERMLSASGPTGGVVRRPSDGKIPQEVVFIQCCGSRDPQHGVPYCSRVCCMYTAKHALLYKHAVHGGQAYVFYIDIRSDGKGYEEFVQRAIEEEKILYLRGKVSKVFRENGKLVVWGSDTLTGQQVEVAADLVVLAMALVPNEATRDLARKLKVATDEWGFLSEAHPKLRPVETMTAGVYLAGAAQAPRDIPDTVAQASGTASKVLSLFAADELLHDPQVANVNAVLCRGCGYCVAVCPYSAISLREQTVRGRKMPVAYVNAALCNGCGTCAATCLSGAIDHLGFTDQQILAQIEQLGEGNG
ncbi:MAG: CoB--CoM heterodisulfide reductase iron-sulfur subunit A family protein [Pseudomonadota bacterium]